MRVDKEKGREGKEKKGRCVSKLMVSNISLTLSDTKIKGTTGGKQASHPASHPARNKDKKRAAPAA